MKKIIFLLVVVVMVCFPQISISEDLKQQLESCSKIENNIKRLHCYDALVGANKTTENSSADNWHIRTEKSKLTDTKTVYIQTFSLEEINNRYGKKTSPLLSLRCENNKTEAFINWDMFLGTGDISVTYRIDKEKVKKATWIASTDSKAVFVNRPIGFIKNLMDKQVLLVEVVPYGDNRRMVEFDITGLREVIVPLQKACGWK